jgi:hypothetical protein
MTSVERIMIQAPKIDDDSENIYNFSLVTISGEPITYESECLYSIKTEKEEQMLTIPSKDDLRYFSNTFTELKTVFLENHEEWFEEKFTSSALDDLFNNFLCANVEENCVDLKILISSNTKNKLKANVNEDTCSVIPIFLFDSIVLNTDNNKISCVVYLHDFHLPKEEMKQTRKIAEEPLEEPVEEKSNSIESKLEKADLEELVFDTTNLLDSDVKVNVEDYLTIYKYILGKIKDNKITEIDKIFTNKGIEMEILNYEDIFDESDDEYLSSDDDSEKSNDED